MMRFVYDENVPACFQRLFHALLAVGEHCKPAENQLCFEEWIPVARSFAAFFVVDVEPEVEPAEQFDEPLMYE